MDERKKTEPVLLRTGTRVAGPMIEDGLFAVYSPKLWLFLAVNALPNVPEMPVQIAPEYGITGVFEIISPGNLRAWLCPSKSGL